MLSGQFASWVMIASILAVPLGYIIARKWLENFAYKTELSWWIFVLAGVLAIGIALLTVSWQSSRAARRNPVESLKYE
jgi:putative ABC transport system permease protein